MGLIAYLKYAWGWCKVNWKFLVGFAIPIIISIVLRQRREKKILEDGLEFRRNQLKIEKEAASLEASVKDKANSEHRESVKDIENNHLSNLEDLEDEHSRKISEIDTAEKATAAIKERLEK